MHRRILISIFLLGVALFMVSACAPEANSRVPVENTSTQIEATLPAYPVAPENTPATPTLLPTASTEGVSQEVQASPTASIAPDQHNQALNPLTGLPVANPSTLSYSPALVSITNFPTSARPQAGLSFSPFVFEMYVGEGMTRFLAVFHGDYPEKGTTGTESIALSDDRIGPVRSGRLPYESLRMLYNGFLVMASASPNVKQGLNGFTNVWGSDTGDINSAMIPATKLKEIAAANPQRLIDGMLSGLLFDASTPENGKPASQIWIPYSFLNQVIWRYDAPSGAYHRYQDNADGATFIKATDRLTNDPLTYENIIVLFVTHKAQRETLIDLDLLYIDRMPALLFRDGTMYEVFWTTANGDFEKETGKLRPIRFIDTHGNPFPLKPGQTWVEIVQPFTRYNETARSETYMELKRGLEPGSGSWAIHFYPPVPER